MSKTAPPLPRSAWMVGSSPTMTTLLNCSIAPPTRHRVLQRSPEHALGRGHGVRLVRIDRHRLAQRPRQPLVARLDHRVIVLAVKSLDMQGDAGRLGEGLSSDERGVGKKG